MLSKNDSILNMTKTFDVKCYELARAFLEEADERELNELASSIQSSIELFLEDHRNRKRNPEAFVR